MTCSVEENLLGALMDFDLPDDVTSPEKMTSSTWRDDQPRSDELGEMKISTGVVCSGEMKMLNPEPHLPDGRGRSALVVIDWAGEAARSRGALRGCLRRSRRIPLKMVVAEESLVMASVVPESGLAMSKSECEFDIL
ncbi:hypothetical protein Dimus_019909 [Dionaea muscipula]